jgi:hypothetical protein
MAFDQGGIELAPPPSQRKKNPEVTISSHTNSLTFLSYAFFFFKSDNGFILNIVFDNSTQQFKLKYGRKN